MSQMSYIGRQPIVDQYGKLQGYELLYRDADIGAARILNAEHATASVLTNLLSNMGFDALTDGKLAFVNFNDRMLIEDFGEILPPDRIVLEILEGTELTSDLIERCKKLRQRGYRLALDDYVAGSVDEPFLNYVDIVKLDMLAMDGITPDGWMESVKRHGVTLLGEKVETWDAFDYCKQNGCTLFQGYFFARPEVLSSGDLLPSQTALLNALRLIGSDADLERIEDALSRDTGLIYKILRYANAAAFTRAKRIESLRGALVLLGRERLKVWLSLLLYVTAEEQITGNTLLDLAKVRSTLMAVFGEELGLPRSDCNEVQVVGSFSLLDALLKRPIDDLVERLALPSRMADALISRGGFYGRLLGLVEALEKPEPSQLVELARETGIEANRLEKLQLEAMARAIKIFDI